MFDARLPAASGPGKGRAVPRCGGLGPHCRAGLVTGRDQVEEAPGAFLTAGSMESVQTPSSRW